MEALCKARRAYKQRVETDSAPAESGHDSQAAASSVTAGMEVDTPAKTTADADSPVPRKRLCQKTPEDKYASMVCFVHFAFSLCMFNVSLRG